VKRALVLIALAAGCVALAGVFIGRTMHLAYGHAVYCALGTAATVGCDKTPADGTARLASAAVIVTCIPLFAAAYGSVMSAHLRRHMDLHRRATVAQIRHDLDEVKAHTRKTVNGAATSLHRRLDDHEDLIRAMAADGPVRGGAGGNPARSEGLSAEETGPAGPAAPGPVVPPPAADPPLGVERVVPPSAPDPAGGM
jgi:hypothetical protein